MIIKSKKIELSKIGSLCPGSLVKYENNYWIILYSPNATSSTIGLINLNDGNANYLSISTKVQLIEKYTFTIDY